MRNFVREHSFKLSFIKGPQQSFGDCDNSVMAIGSYSESVRCPVFYDVKPRRKYPSCDRDSFEEASNLCMLRACRHCATELQRRAGTELVSDEQVPPY
jgi:hypothetical protein